MSTFAHHDIHCFIIYLPNSVNKILQDKYIMYCSISINTWPSKVYLAWYATEGTELHLLYVLITKIGRENVIQILNCQMRLHLKMSITLELWHYDPNLEIDYKGLRNIFSKTCVFNSLITVCGIILCLDDWRFYKNNFKNHLRKEFS